MYSDCNDRGSPHAHKTSPSVEIVVLSFAIGCALAALAIYLMPNETLEWAVAHFG